LYVIFKSTLSDSQLQNLSILGSLQLQELKTINRDIHLHSRQEKIATQEAKSEVDRLRLGLQNLNYERLHLEQEIAKCEDYE